MSRSTSLASVVAIALMVPLEAALAAEQAPAPATPQAQEQAYGRDLMTEEERAAHHARMRAAGSEEERQQIRRENHQRMQERARERGLSIPGEPPAVGAGKKDGTHSRKGQTQGYSH